MIPALWLAVMFFGLAMCRLAACSDQCHAVAMSTWIARGRPLPEWERHPQEHPFEGRGGAGRAAG